MSLVERRWNAGAIRADRPRVGQAGFVMHHRGAAPRFDPAELMRRLMPGPSGRGQPLVPFPTLLPEFGFGRRVDRPAPATLGRLGQLEVRLARNPVEVRRAQKLRYEVFYEEMSAVPSPAAAMLKRDADAYDAVCDHVLVLDHAALEPKPFRKPEPRVVATYRLLRQEVADLNGGFYSAGEFDVAGLLDRHPGLRFLELGRSCVLKRYRTKRTVELLWHGVWSYILHHGIDAMLGCASLEGTDPSRLAVPLSFLHSEFRAPPDWRVRARQERYVAMDGVAPPHAAREAMKTLPPLMKGYLRLGAWVGDGAVVDRQFGTIDVFMILPSSRISERYLGYFGPQADRHAA